MPFSLPITEKGGIGRKVIGAEVPPSFLKTTPMTTSSSPCMISPKSSTPSPGSTIDTRAGVAAAPTVTPIFRCPAFASIRLSRASMSSGGITTSTVEAARAPTTACSGITSRSLPQRRSVRGTSSRL